VENGADMAQIKTSRCKISLYVILQTATKYATKSAMHDQILYLKTDSLKSYYFHIKVLPIPSLYIPLHIHHP
jgi:hypothetical protein